MPVKTVLIFKFFNNYLFRASLKTRIICLASPLRGCIINKIEALRIVYTKTFSTTYPNKFNKKEADHDL